MKSSELQKNSVFTVKLDDQRELIMKVNEEGKDEVIAEVLITKAAPPIQEVDSDDNSEEESDSNKSSSSHSGFRFGPRFR